MGVFPESFHATLSVRLAIEAPAAGVVTKTSARVKERMEVARRRRLRNIMAAVRYVSDRKGCVVEGVEVHRQTDQKNA